MSAHEQRSGTGLRFARRAVLFTGSRDKSLCAIDVETRNTAFRLQRAHAYGTGRACRRRQGVRAAPTHPGAVLVVPPALAGSACVSLGVAREPINALLRLSETTLASGDDGGVTKVLGGRRGGSARRVACPPHIR